MAGIRIRIAFSVVSGAFVAARGVGQPAASPYDVTTYSVVWTVPEVKNAKVVRGVKYAGEGASALVLDLAYPSGGDAAARWPAVVFVNGVGGKLNDWEIYKSWARLAAAHGLVGITAESNPGNPAESVRALFAYLAREGAALKIDASRLAVWACSANVTAAFPFLMGGAPAGVRAAVILYGTGQAAALRKDLPVFWVLAGRDGPSLVEGQRALWARAVADGAPWTMVNAPDLPYAFDGVEDTPRSRQLVKEIVDFLVVKLAPAAPAPRHRAHVWKRAREGRRHLPRRRTAAAPSCPGARGPQRGRPGASVP